MSAPTPSPPTARWTLRCPVCHTPVPADRHPATACPTCGLPAAGHAGLVVGRIGVTLDELHRDRDELLAVLRRSARSGPAAQPTRRPAPAPAGPAPVGPTAPHPVAPGAPPSPPDRPAAGRHRLSPQEVLVGLGALLVVGAALALVAVAWTRFGLVFQSAVMLAATTTAVLASGWSDRRSLRATAEALAATATALLVIDLGAARSFGLLGLQAVPGSGYAAGSAALVAAGGGLLAHRLPGTRTWALVSLITAQPVLLLLLGARASGPLGVGALLMGCAVGVAVTGRLGGPLRQVAGVLAAAQGAGGGLLGVVLAWEGSGSESVLSTLLLTTGAVVGVVAVVRSAGAAHRVTRGRVAWLAAAPALASAGSLQWLDAAGAPVTAFLGLALLTGAAIRWAGPLLREFLGGPGLVLVSTGVAVLAFEDRPAALAAVALAATAPAVAGALRVPGALRRGSAAALLAPALALLTAHEGAVLDTPTTGLLLALLAAAALGLATVAIGTPLELAAAGTAPLIGLAAAGTGAAAGAWGQLAAQLAVVGAAGLGYAVAGRRTGVLLVALADLVLAGWIGLAGAQVATVEGYSLPLAAALLVAAGGRLRRGSSWVGWGPGVLVGFLPSVLVGLTDGRPTRMLLVVAAGTVAVLAATLTHRQAPFAVGAASVGVTGVALLAPYAARVDSWITLGAAGLALLAVGATYERRRTQAVEAVAWVAQMS